VSSSYDRRQENTLTIEVRPVRDGLCTGAGAARVSVVATGPVAADVRVQHKRVLVEVRAHITLSRTEQRRGRRPRARVGVASRDVRRDLVTREVPHLDAGAVPEVREDAAVGRVEPVPERAVVRVGEGAAGVVAVRRLAGRAEDVARERAGDVLGGRGERGGLRVERAACAGVERVLVGRVRVHALDNVDLAPGGPVRAGAPPTKGLLSYEREIHHQEAYHAGQTPQPCGIAKKSAMKSPLLYVFWL
jgi:hypothetical protein